MIILEVTVNLALFFVSTNHIFAAKLTLIYVKKNAEIIEVC